MSDILLTTNSECPAKTISQDDLFNLKLIKDDKIADILFLIGTLISMYSDSNAEQSIVCPEEKRTSSLSSAAQATALDKRILLFLLLFLGASIILVYTSSTRLSKQKADLTKAPDQSVINNIAGSELNILGLLFRVIGYVISIAGIQLRADNPI